MTPKTFQGPCWKTPPNVCEIFLGKAVGDASVFCSLAHPWMLFYSLGPSLDVIERPWEKPGETLEGPGGVPGGPLGVLGGSLGGPWGSLGAP